MLGADGYYMKESPEYNFSKTISKQNFKDFKDNADKCFERSYLREIYTAWVNAKKSKDEYIWDALLMNLTQR